MSYRRTIATLALVVPASGVAGVAQPPLCRHTNFINAQFVPTADIAKKIYKAVGEGLDPNLLKEYPIIEATDAGDHWSMWQMNNKPPPKAGPNEVIVTAGGRQLHMDINKCSGAISNAADNR
ncbi:MAG TPA: hypothetical protein VJ476_01090 [Rhizomicrobium sp.]|nr:hypothetical protein [Rhizomicrobium sp.]